MDFVPAPPPPSPPPSPRPRPPDQAPEEKKRPRESYDVVCEASSLECPVCMETFEGAVFQCKEGHPICGGCRDVLPQPPKCPTCRLSIAKAIRNRFIEELAAKIPIQVKCGFVGCDFVASRAAIHPHRAGCKHRPRPCPCGSGCSWHGPPTKAQEHIASAHMGEAAKPRPSSKLLPGVLSYFNSVKGKPVVGNSTVFTFTLIVPGYDEEMYLVRCEWKVNSFMWGAIIPLGITEPGRKFRMQVEGHGARICAVTRVRESRCMTEARKNHEFPLAAESLLALELCTGMTELGPLPENCEPKLAISLTLFKN